MTRIEATTFAKRALRVVDYFWGEMHSAWRSGRCAVCSVFTLTFTERFREIDFIAFEYLIRDFKSQPNAQMIKWSCTTATALATTTTRCIMHHKLSSDLGGKLVG